MPLFFMSALVCVEMLPNKKDQKYNDKSFEVVFFTIDFLRCIS
jgi:hypothetical protein